MNTLKVEYNGFTGELVKLEATYLSGDAHLNSEYDLVLFDREKKCEYSFKGVKLEDIKFLGGAVSFVG